MSSSQLRMATARMSMRDWLFFLAGFIWGGIFTIVVILHFPEPQCETDMECEMMHGE